MEVKSTLRDFDKYLHSKNVRFEATVIGATALVLLDVVIRQTVDVDCLSPKIPELILKLAEEFRKMRPELELIPNWLNNGPDSLLQD
jgi:hypothetical protein